MYIFLEHAPCRSAHLTQHNNSLSPFNYIYSYDVTIPATGLWTRVDPRGTASDVAGSLTFLPSSTPLAQILFSHRQYLMKSNATSCSWVSIICWQSFSNSNSPLLRSPNLHNFPQNSPLPYPRIHSQMTVFFEPISSEQQLCWCLQYVWHWPDLCICN
jgi:hypothetical protein